VRRLFFGTTEGSDICDSTIEKDLFAMRMDFDAPIKYSKRDKGYYYEDENFSIDKIPLSEDDIEAIKFATNTLMQFRDVSIFKQFGFAIDKIFDRVHIANNPTDEMVENYVQFENQPVTFGNEMLPELLKAIKERQIY
jgi:predicted DNA-binding transcriptional regulator YafY